MASFIRSQSLCAIPTLLDTNSTTAINTPSITLRSIMTMPRSRTGLRASRRRGAYARVPSLPGRAGWPPSVPSMKCLKCLVTLPSTPQRLRISDEVPNEVTRAPTPTVKSSQVLYRDPPPRPPRSLWTAPPSLPPQLRLTHRPGAVLRTPLRRAPAHAPHDSRGL